MMIETMWNKIGIQWKRLWLLVLSLILSGIFFLPNEANAAGIIEDEPIFGGKFYFEEHGKQNKINLILCHGTGDLGAKIWENSIDFLAKDFRVYAFDLPGFGRSDKQNKLYSPENYSEFIKWFIEIYTMGPVYLVGHSMGGAISLYFAGTYPDAIERLVLVDAAGILHRAAFTKNMLNGLFHGSSSSRSSDLLKAPLSSIQNLMNSTIESLDFGLMPENMDGALKLKAFRKTALGGDPIKISGMAMIQTDFSRFLERVKVPTYIIWGEKDPIAPIRTGYLLAERISESYLTVLDGLEHNPMLESPERYQEALGKALTGDQLKPFQKTWRQPFRLDQRKSHTIQKGNGVVVQGDFDVLEIKDSPLVTVRNTSASKIIISNSKVLIRNSVVRSPQIGIDVSHSILHLTGVSVFSQTAIHTFNSELDIAGSYLQGGKESISSDFKTTVLFSVSQVDSPYQSAYAHQVVKLLLGERF